MQKAREERRNGAARRRKTEDQREDRREGLSTTPKARSKNSTRSSASRESLILTVTENGFGKRTDVDEYRLTARGAQGVNNLKATPKVGKTASILLVNETSELMVISQYGKIIRIDTKTIRAAGRATQGVRLLNLEDDDKVAAAVIIPPEEIAKDDEPTLLQ